MIERSKDLALIKTLCTHPKIFPHIADDYSDPQTWQPVESENVVYLLAIFARRPIGLAVFIPQTWVCYQAHVGFLPQAYGGPALLYFKEMLGWMWANTKAERIVGEIVRENRLAIRFVMKAGFLPYGVNQKSFRRGGILHDQVCLGISKPENL